MESSGKYFSNNKRRHQYSFCIFEQGHDPDSYINEHGLEAFQKLLDESISLSSYFLSKVKEFNLETLEGRAQAASFAIPIVNKRNK